MAPTLLWEPCCFLPSQESRPPPSSRASTLVSVLEGGRGTRARPPQCQAPRWPLLGLGDPQAPQFSLANRRGRETGSRDCIKRRNWGGRTQCLMPRGLFLFHSAPKPPDVRGRQSCTGRNTPTSRDPHGTAAAFRAAWTRARALPVQQRGRCAASDHGHVPVPGPCCPERPQAAPAGQQTHSPRGGPALRPVPGTRLGLSARGLC